MKRTFLIAPVRGQTKDIHQYMVEILEGEGYEVHWPARDTNQEGTSLEICKQNREAMRKADVVHFIWDGISQGCLFDLGMAFEMEKPIIVLKTPPLTPEKSFQNLVVEWALDEKMR